MDKINFDHIKKPEADKKKVATYRFQDCCKNIADLTGVAYGVCLALWNKVGNEIYQIEAEIRQGEVKNPQAYIFWKLKNQQL